MGSVSIEVGPQWGIYEHRATELHEVPLRLMPGWKDYLTQATDTDVCTEDECRY